tara:strand:+ start:15596 stop:16066 length:471 start_codon:yes stop_codon:yes gene_type:complete
MRLSEVVQYESKIDHLFKTVENIGDFEMQAHWAKYLCILCSGYVEKSVRLLYSDYVHKRSSPQISKFVGKRLGGFQNAKVEKIIELAKTFDDQWAIELEKMSEGRIKDAVNSIVSNRHIIAHGLDTRITVARVKEWHVESRKLIGIIEGHCETAVT